MDARESEAIGMEGPNRELVALLTMHRSGSSLTTSILQKLGMSLGPFDLVGALPTNPYGHFEAWQFQRLNRRVQEWAFGFADDLPTSPEVLARFLQSRGAWPTDRTIPAEWLEEGEGVTRTLIESGSPSGFKDPRTVLVWPFWERIFRRVGGLKIAPVVLLRSPHEIAMSLCARSNGVYSYWEALDVVAVSLERLKAIVDEREGDAPVVRFASPRFRSDLQRLAAAIGLTWNDEVVDQVYDPSCVHQLPMTISHPAQQLYDSLCGEAGTDLDSRVERDAHRADRDARRRESLTHERLLEFMSLAQQRRIDLRRAEAQLAEAAQRANHWQAAAKLAEEQLAEVRAELVQTRVAHDLARQCLEESERNLVQTMERLVSIQEERARADAARSRVAELEAEASGLRCRLDRIESHAVLGPALKSRRRVKQIWLRLRRRDPAAGRSARIDRPA